MNTNKKVNLALVLSVVALLVALASIFWGGFNTTSKSDATPEEFIKSVAKETGVKSKTFDQCTVASETQDLINEDIAEAEMIEDLADLPGLGTPLNVMVTPQQVLIINGAYPEEIFDLIINQVRDNGTVGKEILDSYDGITEATYAIAEALRPLDIENDHYRGSIEASITIFEYSDLQCPFCKQVHPTLKNIADKHEGLLWIYRHLPLNIIHPQAMPAALASECVAEQKGNDAFWQFADSIFEQQDKLNN